MTVTRQSDAPVCPTWRG